MKARYFRYMDSKNWTEFGEVFAREAVLLGGDREIAGRAAIVEFVGMMSDGARTAHQGFLPEIDVLGAGEATGVWAMSDYYEVRGTEPTVGFTGFGHYEDRYVHEDGAWRIARSRLTRIRIVPFEGGLPEFYRRPTA
ncbi:nuclear transport factor 2 family protein [Dactylosporangium sp. AC04546]|uniref:nuclear transport factor 2 family protein n=1 Tax=Dactylosporangium sp. AC04546 TaxID=2862460 RepID=UPI001EDE32C6|nr:nuclear transport factor 2 family protein [Dactylosporangium sp. AC04546]WVK86964.1 nuclear transport factor 2 family protein [Dactylosporangium sp. AC04546]